MKIKTTLSHQVAIIGAGPYGLATAAHLRAVKIETCVFGEPMEFWRNQMPEGMLLRSSWDACHIADPHRASTLDNYSASQRVPVPRPAPLDRFINYGRWFQKRIVPDVDRRDQIRVFACDSSAEAPALQTVDEAFIVLRIEHRGYVDNLLSICNDRPIGLQVPAL